jgi:hypothetical protein
MRDTVQEHIFSCLECETEDDIFGCMDNADDEED